MPSPSHGELGLAAGGFVAYLDSDTLRNLSFSGFVKVICWSHLPMGSQQSVIAKWRIREKQWRAEISGDNSQHLASSAQQW